MTPHFDLALKFEHKWSTRSIKDGTMKQVNPYDFYMLGRVLEPLCMVQPHTEINDAGLSAMVACRQPNAAISKDSILPVDTRASAEDLMGLLIRVFGDGVQDYLPVFWDEKSSATLGSQAENIRMAAEDFDTLFRRQSPKIPIFAVEKKGIYRVDDLVDRAEDHLPESVQKRLPKQARTDITAAGRCLAFDLPTATAFHVWRALETVFAAYYAAITGRTFAEANVKRNWGKYIEALVTAGADKKITANLDHIRAEHRNPVMHPNENVTADQAFSLLGIGYSAITQVMQAIEAQPYAEKALGGIELVEVTLEA